MIKIKLLPGAKFSPCLDENAGYDLFSTIEYILPPMVSHLFPVGIMTAFPKEWVGLIFDRSGMGVKGIMRQAGVIDSGYRGEWKVKLINLGTEVIQITKEKAIAQVVFVPVMKGIEFVDTLPDSIRGDKWNGSSDVK